MHDSTLDLFDNLDAPITVTTQHHIIETTQNEMAKIVAQCRQLEISTDYFMFEFMEWKND